MFLLHSWKGEGEAQSEAHLGVPSSNPSHSRLRGAEADLSPVHLQSFTCQQLAALEGINTPSAMSDEDERRRAQLPGPQGGKTRVRLKPASEASLEAGARGTARDLLSRTPVLAAALPRLVCLLL